jgi:putative phosphoribosyl transferase
LSPPEEYRDRREAGCHLAALLELYSNRDDVIVLALPRGGVPVGYEVANALNAPLDLMIVRKLGVPGREELAMGAIASGGTTILNNEVIRALGIDREWVEEVIERERSELARRERAYRDNRPFPDVRGKIVIVVDDGLATGATMAAAVTALRELDPAKIVVAVPVAASDTCGMLRYIADEVVCARMPEPFGGVGAWYEDFTQTSDDDVRAYITKGSAERRAF